MYNNIIYGFQWRWAKELSDLKEEKSLENLRPQHCNNHILHIHWTSFTFQSVQHVTSTLLPLDGMEEDNQSPVLSWTERFELIQTEEVGHTSIHKDQIILNQCMRDNTLPVTPYRWNIRSWPVEVIKQCYLYGGVHICTMLCCLNCVPLNTKQLAHNYSTVDLRLGSAQTSFVGLTGQVLFQFQFQQFL